MRAGQRIFQAEGSEVQVKAGEEGRGRNLWASLTLVRGFILSELQNEELQGFN